MYMGGCQNYGLCLDAYYNTAPNIEGTQKEPYPPIYMYIYIYRVQGSGFREKGLCNYSRCIGFRV